MIEVIFFSDRPQCAIIRNLISGVLKVNLNIYIKYGQLNRYWFQKSPYWADVSY
jgi:hypothetical protein